MTKLVRLTYNATILGQRKTQSPNSVINQENVKPKNRTCKTRIEKKKKE